MAHGIEKAASWYDSCTRALSYFQDPFLLLIRLYWGWGLMVAGWGKLTNVESTARFFESIGIFWPTFNALLSGSAEFLGGLLLLLGLASRVVPLIVICNLTVAYLTAHTEQALALFSKPNDFVTAPPFLYLLASVIVLLFGPGLISVDALLRRYLLRRAALAGPQGQAAIAPEVAAFRAEEQVITRREVVRLTVAAVGGLVAGALLRGTGERDQQQVARQSPGPTDNGAAPAGAKAADRKALQEIDAQAPAEIKPTLLLEEPHVCRGLNTCKGQAKGGANACAGQGACATAESHVCQGMNACKGQGGCGEFPGQNTCQGKGACAVPLQDKTWAKARKRFEELMALKGQEIGQPPLK